MEGTSPRGQTTGNAEEAKGIREASLLKVRKTLRVKPTQLCQESTEYPEHGDTDYL